LSPGRCYVRVAAASFALLAGLAGCSGASSKSCNKPREYQASKSVAPLQVPEGLDTPDQRARIVIPESRVTVAEPPADRPCLERPPDYFDKS